MTDAEKKVVDYMMSEAGLEKSGHVSWAFPFLTSGMIKDVKTEKKTQLEEKQEEKQEESEPKDDSFFSDFWMLFVLMLILGFGFFPNSDSNSYQQGKIDAYENLLKGFD